MGPKPAAPQSDDLFKSRLGTTLQFKFFAPTFVCTLDTPLQYGQTTSHDIFGDTTDKTRSLCLGSPQALPLPTGLETSAPASRTDPFF